MAAERIDIPDRHRRAARSAPGRVRAGRSCRTTIGTCSASGTRRGREHVQQAIAAAAEAQPRVGRAGPGTSARRCSCAPRSCCTTTWRATLNAATMLGQSKNAFQAEIDAAAEMVDFWRFNPHYAQELYEEQPISTHAMWNAARVPPARGVRLRRDAVQLHVDRRQPADGAGADGQHGHLEAGVERDAERLLHPASCSRRRACRPASSTSCPATPRRSRTSCSIRPTWPASTSPAARRCSSRCGRRSARTSAATRAIRGWSAKPAARTSSSRIRLRTCRSSRSRSRAAASSTRGRSARRRAASMCRSRSGRRSSDRVVAMMRDMKMGDVADFRTFMGAVIDRKAFDEDHRLYRGCAEERDDRPGRERRTTRSGTSSSRRWSRRRSRTTG